jgi:hypothetical protein
MACAPITVLPEEAMALEADFIAGPMLDENGFRFLTEAEVDRAGGLKISVYSNEHPPPHFCVSYQGQSANYEITTGKRLEGQKGLETFNHNIRRWWKANKLKIAKAWNDARPTNCTVGTVDTVALGWESASKA